MRCILLLMTALGAIAAPVQHVSILLPGSFHGEEVPDDAAGRWFALVAEGADATLQAVDVRVTQEVDVIVDAAGEMTGRRVDVSPAIDPVVLLRGIPNLRIGAVPTSLHRISVMPDTPQSTHLGARSYSFRLQCSDVQIVQGQRHQECELLLSDGTRSQVLSPYAAYFEGDVRIFSSEQEAPLILWAGDLDADGRLDLLLDTSNHYNIDEMQLYLSSQAGERELVAPVAAFRATGC